MKTSYTYKSGTLIISVEGSVDGSQAAMFQQETDSILAQYDEVEELVIDAASLEFISSMGLRVLLALKKQYDNMRITGCNAEVFNVFKITGFHHIITVEKALKQVSLDGLKAIEGLPGFYQLTDETMLKVFPKDVTKDDVDCEVALAKEIFILGIPTVMAFDIVRVGERMGLVYERIIPTDVDAATLARMSRSLHDHIIEPGGRIPSSFDIEKSQILKLMPYLGSEVTGKLVQMLSAVPDGSNLLHGNITPSKVMFSDGEPIMINMEEVGYGNPILDLAHLYSSLPEEKRGEYFDEFLGAYYDTESDDAIERNRQNIVTLSLIRNYTRLIIHGELSEDDIRLAKSDFEKNITGRWDEILSHLHFKKDFQEEIRKLERQRFYLNSEVSLDWVAGAIGTNRHYVSDYFNKVLHTTFTDYINNLRLDYAVKLLRQGKIPQSQIAYTVGFNNDHTFRRIFKLRYGCTPSQFEK